MSDLLKVVGYAHRRMVSLLPVGSESVPVVEKADIDAANARIAELEAQVAEMQPVWEAVNELERQILKGNEKDIFLGVSDDIPPCVHLNFDWIGTLAECLIAEAWKEDPARRTAALIALAKEVESE